MKNTTQNGEILVYLQKGNKITALTALEHFGCLRLSARIHNIRDWGFDVKTEIVKTKTGKHIAEYSL